MIRVEDVTRTHYQGETEVRALRGVTCQFPTGSLTFILGPSGSGKSTLLYLMGALDAPTSGEIQVDDRPLSRFTVRERDEYRRKTVGFVFQSFNLLSNLDALDNVLVPFMPLGVTPADRTRAAEVLERVGLGHRMHHRPHQLSGGEQQRIAIARALLKNPALVLADEPTGELDSNTGAEVFRYLRAVHEQQQTTVVIVTHDHRYIHENDRLLQMRDGRIVDDSSPLSE